MLVTHKNERCFQRWDRIWSRIKIYRGWSWGDVERSSWDWRYFKKDWLNEKVRGWRWKRWWKLRMVRCLKSCCKSNQSGDHWYSDPELLDSGGLVISYLGMDSLIPGSRLEDSGLHILSVMACIHVRACVTIQKLKVIRWFVKNDRSDKVM